MNNKNENLYRNEIKYILDKTQALQIESRLSLFSIKEQTDNINSYFVRTLYFDNIYNSCFLANREGLPHREKIRIRAYNFDFNTIFIELKKKNYNLSTKKRCLIPNDIVSRIMSNNFNLNQMKNQNEFLFFLCSKIKKDSLLPKIIVDYERIAYSFPFFNTRITIDSNIKASLNTCLFFKQNIPMKTTLDNTKCILEVKYTQILPKFLYEIINVDDLKRINYSKYYYSRKAVV